MFFLGFLELYIQYIYINIKRIVNCKIDEKRVLIKKKKSQQLSLQTSAAMGNSCCACGGSSEFRFSILTGMRKWEVAESTPFIVFLKMAKSCGIPQPIIVSSQL